PIGVFGLIVNQVAAQNGVPTDPIALFASTFVFSLVLCFALAAVIAWRDRSAPDSLGGIGSRAPRHQPGPPVSRTGALLTASPVQTATMTDDEHTRTRMTAPIAITLACLVAMVVVVVVFSMDIGFAALTAAVVLAFVSRRAGMQAVGQIAWTTIFLVVGIVTYVGVLQSIGAVDYVSDAIGALGSPLLVALLICVIGAVVSAFASTTGILGALVPLAVPFMLAGAVNPIMMLIALSISSSVVDSSPFSTSGALIVANAEENRRDAVFSLLLRWGILMMVVAPLAAWVILILPGW